MSPFFILMNKEFAQMLRDFKLVWLPIVFIFLGMTQPVLTYYLPTILEALGGGQGITIDPTMIQQEGGQVLATTLGSQFDQLGIMIIVISMMGMIQADKTSGMLAFILTRPVTVWSYVTGKIISNYLLVIVSVAFGYLISFLYVNYLFTEVSISHMLVALLIYSIWVLFMVSFTLMISTIFKGQGVIALIGIVFLLLCRMIIGLHPTIDLVNPAGMSQHAMTLLFTGSVDSSLFGNIATTSIWILLTLFVAHFWIAQKKFQQD
ncbi:ABC transporter permease [Bacillus sp. FJAT-22090]|uniref:ABC transporter permease n=1 Tax=Bacillus sp. FJAT-22090 TaxID=1581038 RepID=UPI0011A01D80|nr:ABC transporter permease subunit [Bacillus sp. FJAT-22090]